MTPERMERAIEFLLENHARLTVTVERMSERVDRMSEKVDTLADTVHELSEQAVADRLEIRESFEKLIQANEITRALSERIGELAVATSRRTKKLEDRMARVERELAARRPGRS